MHLFFKLMQGFKAFAQNAFDNLTTNGLAAPQHSNRLLHTKYRMNSGTLRGCMPVLPQ